MLYIENANKHSSHPCDRDRFVSFVKCSHDEGDNSIDTVIELEEILLQNNFPEYTVNSLLSNYEFGRLVLK